MSSYVILWQSAARATALPTAFPQHRGAGFRQVPPGRIPSDAVGTTVTSLPSWDPRSLPGAGGLQLSPSGSPHVCSSGHPVADSVYIAAWLLSPDGTLAGTGQVQKGTQASLPNLPTLTALHTLDHGLTLNQMLVTLELRAMPAHGRVPAAGPEGSLCL